MKKVIALVLLASAATGCSLGEVYVKAGHRQVHEHQESQRTHDKPGACALWNFSFCNKQPTQVEGS